MLNYDLSILIPARNEEFLGRTIEDIMANIEGKTEVIAVLDGYWPKEPIADYPNLTIIHFKDSIGQRAATNEACKISRAKYVMKVDAHCAFDKGFDRKLMEEMHDDWTIIPMMMNLHAFNWVCKTCGNKWYQGQTPKHCMIQLKSEEQIINPACNGKEFTREMVWKPKHRTPHSTSFCFDSEPHFQYFNDFKDRKEGKGKITETMSIQGSCFMLTREKYIELNICDDETFGSWGSQGIEVACKTWLSGGKVMCHHETWYAHMFRTQGGDFGFPYQQSGRGITRAKKTAKEVFFNNAWEKQIYPLSWLLERFWPVYGWSQEEFDNLKKVPLPDKKENETKGIIYYTDNQLKVKIAKAVQRQLLRISRKKNIPIVSVSLKPMPHFGKNVHLKLKRGIITMFRQIITALETIDTDIVFFCEHDVIYHPSHFDFIPSKKDKFYYNQNFWKVWPDGFVAHWDANQVSGLCGYREHLLEFYRKRLKEIEEKGFNRSYEPGGRDKSLYETWNSDQPNIDIRHDGNLTKSHRSPADFRDKSCCVNWKEGTINDIWYKNLI